MKNRLLTTIIILTLGTFLVSCEGVVKGSGKVISAVDKLPITYVRIKWRAEETYTDSLGNFEIGQFVGCPTGCPELELTLEKVGYETKYINVTKENGGAMHNKDLTIELTPTDKVQTDILNNKFGNVLYYTSMVIAGLGLLTLFVPFILKVDKRWLWFFIIFFGTIAFQYNFLAHVFNFKILRPVTQFNPPHFRDPAWYKLSLPIGAILFWKYHFKIIIRRL
jgi:hypothetical protein